jgi:hypothetical protein
LKIDSVESVGENIKKEKKKKRFAMPPQTLGKIL